MNDRRRTWWQRLIGRDTDPAPAPAPRAKAAATPPRSAGAATSPRDAGAARSLQLLLDHMPDAVLAIDRAERIEWINPSARLMFQAGAADLVGQPVRDWIPALPVAETTRATLPMGMLPPQTEHHELEARRRDGSRFPLEVVRLDLVSGGRASTFCLCRDLTEQRRMERMQHEFVSMVSHELRTPLTSLSASLHLLTDGTIQGLGDDARYLIGMAHDNAERMVRLVNDILDFEKLRAGALEVQFEAVDLAEAARGSAASLQALAQRAGVSFEVIDAGVELPVRADPARLAQVLANLLSNAVKHSPPRSAVQLRPVPVAERARLEVIDQGAGVPPEFVEHLFEPFQQARDPQRRQQGGTGLGLAISRALMDLMGGSIGHATVPGRSGACFWIELPLHAARPSTLLDDV